MNTRDISKEFEEMKSSEFEDFLFNLSLEATSQLTLIINTSDIIEAKRLKAINEYYKYENIQYSITIQTTIENYQKELNVFASGIKRKQI